MLKEKFDIRYIFFWTHCKASHVMPSSFNGILDLYSNNCRKRNPKAPRRDTFLKPVHQYLLAIEQS